MTRLLPHLCLLLAILGLTLGLCLPGIGAEATAPILTVPTWVLRGIAYQESRSHYRADGSLVYVDRHDGAAGEVGPFQMKRAAFAQVHLRNLRWLCREDPVCAEFCAIVYLRWCYGLTGDWRRAVAIYHAGPDGDAQAGAEYLRDVVAAGHPNF